jgi:glycosyltransferase involved in cell wall biosynthesis
MEISVIVISYAFEKYISKCINSILDQNIDVEYEILVRDDHSGDNTNEILRREFGHLDNIRIIESDKNVGAFENLKLLISLSTGKYIAHIDGDDYFTSPGSIKDKYLFLEGNSEFSMISSGYKTLDEGGNFSVHNHPLKDIVTQEDMIENNWVTFGRIWRREHTETKEWLSKIPYLDWAFNYSIAKHGKIKCEYNEGGVYRISNDGMFSKKSKSDKRINYLAISNALSNMYNLENKVITITDCFVRDQQIEKKLKSSLIRAKILNNDILLVSNTPVAKDVMGLCNYFIYDRRNQLFQKEYPNIDYVNFYINTGDFIIHNVTKGMQRHGLSVLINLHNSVLYAKTLGYKYFQRMECDDIFGSISLEKIKDIQEECIALNKKGVFYVNDSEANISFHYFFCEIDYFLNSVKRISSEKDYEKYIHTRMPYPKFMIAEEFIYENIMGNPAELQLKNGGIMNIDFPDTKWNTETSDSNMDSKFSGCISGIYGSSRGDVVCTYNYSTGNINRRIEVIKESGDMDIIYHKLEGHREWMYNQFDSIREIFVYNIESGDLLYSQKKVDSKSYIDF